MIRCWLTYFPFQNPKCSECLNDDICPKNFSNEKKSPTKRAKVTKKKEPKTEIKTEPQDLPGSLNALEPVTGNELASGDAPIVKNAKIKTEYAADEVPAKISKVSDPEMKPGPSKMTTRGQKKES